MVVTIAVVASAALLLAVAGRRRLVPVKSASKYPKP